MDFKKFSNLIMIEQTLFALPFAFLGVLFAGGGTPKTWLLVAIALCGARTAGMSFNRVIDADIDAKNPRTKERLIPRGEIQRRDVLMIAIAASLVLIIVSYFLNPLCFYLSFAAVAMLFSYSYFKRFSASSHFYLGLIEAAAPIGGYLAVTGKPALLPFILGIAIMAWIAGLDIVYATQDVHFDAEHNLHSIPVTIGKELALFVSAACYAVSIGAMIISGFLASKNGAYWTSILCVATIFIVQQWIIRKKGMPAAMQQFFRINMFISPILLCGTFIDVFII